MMRAILILLALAVLIVAALFYFQVLNWPGPGHKVEANPVNLTVEQRTVTVPAPVLTVDKAQPAPAQPANAQ